MTMTHDRSGPAWTHPRRVVWVLGDQLWFGHPALRDFDPACDHVLMVEAPGEAAVVWSHKARIALFLSAMRHFCNEVHRRGWAYTYVRLDEQPETPDLDGRALQVLQALQPEQLRLCEPGEWRTLEDARRVRALGAGQERAAPGVLLPRHAPPPPGAHEWARPGGRAMEFRCREPPGVPGQWPRRHPRARVLRARSHHTAGDRAGRKALSRPPGLIGAFWLAGDARAGAGGAGALCLGAAGAFRPAPGCPVDRHPLGLAFAAVGGAQPAPARSARGAGRCRGRLARTPPAAGQRRRLCAPGAGLARIHPRGLLARHAAARAVQPLGPPARPASLVLER